MANDTHTSYKEKKEMSNEKKMDDYSDDCLFNITSWGADLSFRELIQMYEEGELVKPELQRNYVWRKIDASRFIESLLLGLPVPSIFLANTDDAKKLIIDGYQRIMTVYDYVQRKKFSKEESIFRLVNSQIINERWRNKAFDELSPEDQRRIKASTIHAIVFAQKHPKNDDTSLFQIFSRINSSGRALNAQEIRNCICQGEFNRMLIELNTYDKWRILYRNEQPDSRMLDIELILRFFAIRDLLKNKQSKKKINLRKLLDLYMKNFDVGKIDEYRSEFIAMINCVYISLGVTAFSALNLNETYGKHLNPLLFEGLSIAFDDAIRRGVKISDNMEERKRRVLSNDEFIAASKLRTTDVDNIEKRIKIAKTILFPVENG